jgi:hypothetical protein
MTNCTCIEGEARSGKKPTKRAKKHARSNKIKNIKQYNKL